MRTIPTRVLPLVVLVSALAVPAVAHAAPSCRLVTDAAGDSSVPDPAVDIVSADVAANLLRVVAVVRTQDSALAPVPGRAYEVRFRTGGSEFSMTGTVAFDGTSGMVTRDGGQGAGAVGGARVSVDDARHEVRIEASVGMFRQFVRYGRGTRFTDLTAITYQQVGTTQALLPPNSAVRSEGRASVADMRDLATSNATYVVGTRSCVGA